MKKSVWTTLLAVCLCAVLITGCGSSSSGSSAASENTAAPKSTAAPETAAPAQSSDASSSVEAASAAPIDAQTIVKVLANDPVKIAYIPLSTAGVTNKMVQLAFNDTIDAYKATAEVVYFDPAYDLQTQITMVNNCVAEKYDCIMLEAIDPNALANPVAEAEAAGIPVITVNLKALTTYTLDLRGVDYTAGWKAADVLAEKLGADEELNVVIVDFPAAMLSTALQSAGFLDYMEENTNWNLLDQRCIDNISSEGANTAVRDILTAYDDIDIIFNTTDDLTSGTIQAIKAAGRDDGSITVYGNYGTPATFADLLSSDGVLYGLNFFDYYTQYSIAMSYALYHAATHATALTMGLNETPVLANSVFPVTRENAEMYNILSRWDLALAQD